MLNTHMSNPPIRLTLDLLGGAEIGLATINSSS